MNTRGCKERVGECGGICTIDKGVGSDKEEDSKRYGEDIQDLRVRLRKIY